MPANNQSWRLSSDTHVVEPPDLFTTRVDREYRDEAPRVVRREGGEVWRVGESDTFPPFLPARAGDRFLDDADRPDRWSPRTWKDCSFETDVPVGAYDPDAWLADLESDGVHGGIAFPTVTMVFYNHVKDTTKLDHYLRTMNDWLLEFSAAHPDRIGAAVMLNVDDADAAVAELTRTKEKGARAALVPVRNPHGYPSPQYDALWAAAADLDIPLQMHIATTRWPDPLLFALPGDGTTDYAGIQMMVNGPAFNIRSSLTEMVYSGVFERHPGLKVVSVENEGSWVFPLMERLDWNYRTNMRVIDAVAPFKNDALPSDFIRQNVYISFTEDAGLVQRRHELGVGNLMWGSDYPHAESTHPYSTSILGEMLEGVPTDEQQLMLQTTCAELYGFDTSDLPTPAIAA